MDIRYHCTIDEIDRTLSFDTNPFHRYRFQLQLTTIVPLKVNGKGSSSQQHNVVKFAVSGCDT
ncbi:hypothetical protein BLOT_010595 [Blomia tropicalis]|nr:hypothetical protein BLOT_010595 [Blomia tropicalis]